jgi:hypothetical protein
MKENRLDQLAKDALKNYRAPYDPDAWGEFERQLDRRGPLLPRLRAVKSVEVLLLGLALLTMIYVAAPSMGSFGPSAIAKQKPIAPAQVPSNGHAAPAATIGENSTEANAETPYVQASPTAARSADGRTAPALPEGPVSRADETWGQTAQAASPTAPQTVADAGTPPPTEALPVAEASPQEENPLSAAAPVLSERTLEINPIAMEEEEEGTQDLDRQNHGDIDAGPNDEVAPSAMPVATENTPVPSESAPVAVAKAEVQPPGRKRNAAAGFYAGASFAPEMNFLGPNAHSSIGFSAQGEVSYGFSDQLFVEVGLRFSLKRFYEKRTVPVNGDPTEPIAFFMDETRSSSSYHFGIPLTLRYMTKQRRGTAFYVAGGVGANLVGWNFVGVERTAQDPQNNGTIGLAYNNAGYEGQEEPGAFQGAPSGVRNFFATAHIGMGVQFRASNNASVYLEPRYQQALTPIGREPIRFGAFGLSIGARVSLR